MPDTAVFQLNDVIKRYGDTVAVDRVSLEIAQAQTTVLIGPSGCGKSTLLRLLIGLIEPTSGHVQFEGQSVQRSNIRKLRHRMGYVIQDGGLFPHMTARQNATIMARYLGWDAERMDARIAELADLTHFPRDGLDRYPSHLSGGQRQRVSLMRALMLDPDVLLMDEPLGALDPIIRHNLQTELREIFRTLDKSVVMVTHDLAEAGYFGDSIVLMRDGAIVQQGAFRALIDQPADPFVRDFVEAQRDPLEEEQAAGSQS
jgi:osmoprotectant transport system ATP-binding protein